MKKHKKNVSDFCAYCTMYRAGTSGGSNVPTAFIMKGKKIMTGYTDKMQKYNGADHGSTVVMTENAFMTEEAWLTLTPNLIEGYREMPFIRNNTQCYIIEIFYGFGSPLCNHDSLQMRLDANIISIK